MICQVDVGVQIADEVAAIHIDGDSRIVVEVLRTTNIGLGGVRHAQVAACEEDKCEHTSCISHLPSTICSFYVHEKSIWVMLQHPRREVCPFAFIISAAAMKLLVYCAQQLVVVS